MSYKRYFVGKIVTLLQSVYCSTVPDTLNSFAGFRYLKILSLKGKNNNNSLEKQSETSESSLVAKMRWDEHSISRKKNSRFFPGFFLAELKGNRWEPSGKLFLIVIFRDRPIYQSALDQLIANCLQYSHLTTTYQKICCCSKPTFHTMAVMQCGPPLLFFAHAHFGKLSRLKLQIIFTLKCQ